MSIIEDILVDAQNVVKPDLRAYLAALETAKPAKYYGVVGDGLAEETDALNLMFAACADEGNRSCLLGPGVFAVEGPLLLEAADPGEPNRGIAVLGDPWSAMQQGSTDPSCVLKYVGSDAQPILQVDTGFAHLICMSFQNWGNATHALLFNDGGRSYTFMCSFGVPNGASRFTDAAIEYDGFRYEFIDRCEFESAPCIKFSGTGTIASVLRSVLDPATATPHVYLNCNADILAFHWNTFNFATAANKCFDATSTAGTISLLDARENEWDGNGILVNCSVALLKNVKKSLFSGRIDQMGSNDDNPIILTNSRARIEDIVGASIAMPLARTTDATSFIDCGQNELQPNTTWGVIDANSNAGNMIPITLTTPGAGQKAALIHGQYGDPRIDTAYVIEMTTTDTLAIAHSNPPDSGSPGKLEKGQLFSVVIQNNIEDSPPTMNTITFEPTQFNLTGSVTPPTYGNQIEIFFRYNGTKCVERSPRGASVAFA